MVLFMLAVKGATVKQDFKNISEKDYAELERLRRNMTAHELIED